MVKNEIYDLIVVGGGYWGSGIAFEALKLGKKVLVIDDEDRLAGSRAASGICDPKAYSSSVFAKLWPSHWNKSELKESFYWLFQYCEGYTVTENFWNKFNNTQPRKGNQCIYIPHFSSVTDLVSDHRIVMSAKSVQKSGKGWRVLEDSGEGIQAKQLVLACGYRSSELYSGVPVSSLYGRGIIAKGSPLVDTPVSVMIKPYCKHTVRKWKNSPNKRDVPVYKIGDTAEKSVNPKALEALRTVGKAVLLNYQEDSISEGYRPVMDKFTVEKVEDNLILATGGHRVALGLTGLVANRVMRMLK